MICSTCGTGKSVMHCLDCGIESGTYCSTKCSLGHVDSNNDNQKVRYETFKAIEDRLDSGKYAILYSFSGNHVVLQSEGDILTVIFHDYILRALDYIKSYDDNTGHPTRLRFAKQDLSYVLHGLVIGFSYTEKLLISSKITQLEEFEYQLITLRSFVVMTFEKVSPMLLVYEPQGNFFMIVITLLGEYDTIDIVFPKKIVQFSSLEYSMMDDQVARVAPKDLKRLYKYIRYQAQYK